MSAKLLRNLLTDSGEILHFRLGPKKNDFIQVENQIRCPLLNLTQFFGHNAVSVQRFKCTVIRPMDWLSQLTAHINCTPKLDECYNSLFIPKTQNKHQNTVTENMFTAVLLARWRHYDDNCFHVQPIFAIPSNFNTVKFTLKHRT